MPSSSLWCQRRWRLKSETDDSQRDNRLWPQDANRWSAIILAYPYPYSGKTMYITLFAEETLRKPLKSLEGDN